MRILAISGSLRAASRNSMLLHATARLASAPLVVQLYRELGSLPLFNPDLEPLAPASVAALRAAITGAEALIIASPEYAHGVSGVIKNALDWMVGNESLVRKPVALFNASPRATIAVAALRETLTTMSARVVDAACITVPLLGSALDEEGIVQDPILGGTLRSALRALEHAVQSSNEPDDPPVLPL